MFNEVESFEQDNLELNDPKYYQNEVKNTSLDGIDSNLETQKESVTNLGDWIDRGVIDVDVNKINLKDSGVHSPEDFHKVSLDEMVQGFEKLESEVKPAVKSGADKDYFLQKDKESQLEYKDGSQRVYESFYGDGSIRLNRVGEHYEVINGYHRLYVAKELNIPTVPARVIEKQYY
jgi:hypothetical protein